MQLRISSLFLGLASAVAACGGKVVLDATSGAGASGTGGTVTTISTTSGTTGIGGDGVTSSSSSSGGTCVNPVTDCPNPGTVCALPACLNGTCGLANTAQGVPCTDDGGTVCNGAGQCVQCNSAMDCPAEPGACVTSTCVEGTCGVTNATTGTACSTSGGTVCDGKGHCVPCVSGSAACCLQTCEADNITAYDTFVGYELVACGCKAGAPCESVCTSTCQNPATITGTSPCGMCLTAQTLDEMSSACTLSAGETCLGDPKCSAFVQCGLMCP